ncbi:MAG TPA: SRPBCC domain-containing protein [Caulobacteraceae bacterium]|nr:SRPBCC domain-containing protein [Caulobacteraceae bacterium]
MVALGETIRVSGVRFQHALPGPIQRVWAHLTDPAQLSGWYDAGSVIEPREGGAVSLNGGHIRGVVTQWRPLARFAHTWNVFGPGDEVSPYPESYLTLDLAERGAGVDLTLTHLPVLERFEPQNAMGWATFLDILEDTVLGRPVGPRRAYMERNAARYGVDLEALAR